MAAVTLMAQVAAAWVQQLDQLRLERDAAHQEVAELQDKLASARGES